MDRYKADGVEEQVNKWAGTEFNLAISEISYAELINGANKSKIEKVKARLDTFTKIAITQRILVGSAILANVYQVQRNQTSGAGVADLIIASTSFVHDLPLVTADVMDFPHPFFRQDDSENIIYKKKNRDNLITIDVLRPNVIALNLWYQKCR